MKKFVAVLSAAAMLATLAACGSTAATTSTAASSADTAASTSSEAAAADDTAKSYKIAVVQQLDHASLDEIRTAVEAELDAKAAEKGITIEYKDFNGQNDATTLNQIGTQVVSDGYDAVVPIATLQLSVWPMPAPKIRFLLCTPPSATLPLQTSPAWIMSPVLLTR